MSTSESPADEFNEYSKGYITKQIDDYEAKLDEFEKHNFSRDEDQQSIESHEEQVDLEETKQKLRVIFNYYTSYGD